MFKNFEGNLLDAVTFYRTRVASVFTYYLPPPAHAGGWQFAKDDDVCG